MDYYFIQLDTIATNCKISNRTRFKIQDVIDLRKNQWKPRHEKAQPIPTEKVNEPEEEEVNALPTNHESAGSMGDRGPQNDNKGNQGKKRLKPDGSPIVGDGLGTKDRRRYDDNLQLFVGNIPLSTTEEELKVSLILVSYTQYYSSLLCWFSLLESL